MEDLKHRGDAARTDISTTKEEPTLEISSENHFCSIYVSKFRMNKDVGFGIKLHQILEDFNLYYRYIPDGVDAINLILDERELHEKIESELIRRISSDLAADKVNIKRNLTLIILVGGEMSQNISNISRAAQVFANEDINIEMIHMSQGPSKTSLIFGVKASDEEKAVTALYNEFFAGVAV